MEAVRRALTRRTNVILAAALVALGVGAAPASARPESDCSPSTSRYSDAVLGTPGLVAYWRLNDSFGRTACDSTGGWATYRGGYQLSRPGAIATDANAAAGFDGATGYADLASTSTLKLGGPFTLEAWVKPVSAYPSQTVVRKDNQYLLRIYHRSAIVRLWPADTTLAAAEVASPATLRDGVWQHLAAVFDGAALRLYVDGAEVASRPWSGAPRTTENRFYIGASGGSWDFFRGDLDEVAVYQRALSPSAVASHVQLARAAGAAAGVDCGLGTFDVGRWPSACWRPYANESPFNRPVPANPVVLPQSAEIVNAMLGLDPIAHMTVAPDTPSDWYHPVYYSRPTDPIYTVHCVKHSCDVEGLRVRIPAAARPAGGGDGHMAVVDQGSGWEWGFWQVQDKPAGGGVLTVSAGGRTEIRGTGLGSDANAGQWGLLGGIIRAQEMQAGRIDHALFMLVGCVRPGFVYPASGEGAPCADGVQAPATGQYFQLDMTDAEIDALAVPAWKKTILRALARYGAFVGDTGGNESFTFEFESGSTYTSFGISDPMEAFAAAQGEGVVRWNDSWRFDLADGVDWAHRLRVLDPCVARGTC